ncbi:DUF6473 family protein [Actibacterium sp. D379-3]
MYEHLGLGALDYAPCHYGTSKLVFRGPKRRLAGAYCAMIGGTETYGRYVETPFPALVEERTGRKVINLGCVNAGLDVFARDSAVQGICDAAQVTVVQTLGAQNMSNRFYVVHPRRNDRFVRASGLMKSMFREVDFTEFHFTRHMLTSLQVIGPERFALVVEELKEAWVARMRFLAERIRGKRVLLHIADHRNAGPRAERGLGPEPLFVDDDMLAEVEPAFSQTVKVRPSHDAVALRTEGMAFTTLERHAAEAVPGPAVHREVADALAPVIDRLMG